MGKQIKAILETQKVKDYLIKRRLLRQYVNKKENILKSVFSGNYLKLREPKKDEIWYFRINKQYRALAYFDNNILKVFDIDNHQN